MSRNKPQNPLLNVARTYLSQQLPELQDAPLRLRPLDGPAGSPRYAVAAEVCTAANCPLGVPAAIAAAGQCGVRECPLRRSVRLLLDQRGGLIQATRSRIHWG